MTPEERKKKLTSLSVRHKIRDVMALLGSSRSAKKIKAAQENGKLGGYYKKFKKE